MRTRENSTAVSVARITARQAVIVALISCLGGIVVALIGSGLVWRSATPAPVSLRAVRITGIHLDLDSEGRTEQALRVIAVVNGSAKSYPTDGSWAPPNPDLSSEPFIVVEEPEYLVHFEVFAQDARRAITRFSAPSGRLIEARHLPAPRLVLELKEEDTGGLVGGRVWFSIE